MLIAHVGTTWMMVKYDTSEGEVIPVGDVEKDYERSSSDDQWSSHSSAPKNEPLTSWHCFWERFFWKKNVRTSSSCQTKPTRYKVELCSMCALLMASILEYRWSYPDYLINAINESIGCRLGFHQMAKDSGKRGSAYWKECHRCSGWCEWLRGGR